MICNGPTPFEVDHPRSRGVYLRSAAEPPFGAGSSPLARGLLLYGLAMGRRHGIIPARAGFTRNGKNHHARPRDHPRSRGVYAPFLWPALKMYGSSPLARGLLAPCNLDVALDRIIPARAGFTNHTQPVRSPTRDHPRSRGVYALRYRVPLPGPGSSPLARGLLAWGRATAMMVRIIPARAGFTILLRGSESWCPDHPRSRGVYVFDDGRPTVWYGSSPLARGLPHCAAVEAIVAGIIPARAGFTTMGDRPKCRRRDHPRSRGVYAPTHHRESRVTGSSPLARGLLLVSRVFALRHGIIPARAGFTRPPSSPCRPKRDHPRSRGVYCFAFVAGRKSYGSSPLARGLRCRVTGSGSCIRIIPARAGFTRLILIPPRRLMDHPRSRGVYAGLIGQDAGTSGSSPLARGLRALAVAVSAVLGIIPARAGFTGYLHHPRYTGRDHPRSRGVYSAPFIIVPRSWGSSPLARGLRRTRAALTCAWGIIPARAGFTCSTATHCRQSRDHPRSRGVYSIPAPL